MTRTLQARLGLVLLALLALLIVVGPLVAPHDPNAISGQPGRAPSAAHPLGTDLLGRDILSRILVGGETVIALPIVTVCLAIAVATVLGVLAGYLGGVLDQAVTRVLDVVLAIPAVLLVLTVIAGFGRGNAVVVAAVAVVEIPRIARVVRAATRAAAPSGHVLAARARGESSLWIAFGEILPVILPALLVEAALGLTTAVLAIAALSFLGLGVQPPTANWAAMVSENRALLFTHPWGGVLVPAFLIALLAVAVNMTADALSESIGRRSRPS